MHKSLWEPHGKQTDEHTTAARQVTFISKLAHATLKD